MSRRLRPAARGCGVLAIVAAAIGIPTFGTSPVITLLLAGLLLESATAWLLRSDQPELVVIAGWLGGLALSAAGFALSGGPRLYLLPMFAYPMVLIAVLLPSRVVAAATLVTVLVMVGLAFALDGPSVKSFSPTLLYPIVTVLVTTLAGALAREKDVVSRRSALFDDLTGLLNRAALAARAGELAHQTLARTEHVAVLVADVDHFKSINDRHGHARGDAVLAAVAGRMSGVLAGGSLYRLGGEEFVALLPGATRAEAQTQAERIREAVRASPVAGVAVSVSVGVALSTPPGFSFEAVFEAADEALYRAKREGRDRVCLAEQAQTVVAMRSRPSAQRRRPEPPGPDRRPRRASDETELAHSVTEEHGANGGWLVRDRHERAQLVAIAQRSQLLGLLLIYPCALAAVLAAVPAFGWWIPVLPTVGATVLVAVVATLPRIRRPERALAAAWVFAEVCAAGGWLVAHRSVGHSMLVALPALGLLVASFSSAFRPQVVAVGAVISGLLMIAVAYAYDAAIAVPAPGIVATPLAVMITVAVVGSTLGRSTVDHLGAGVVDGLTGMLNRSALRTRTAELESTAVDVSQITLIVGDLDQLKQINDASGHAAGDAVLQEVSRRVRRELRTFDTVYRIGGDEFVALLTSIDEDAAVVAERLRTAVRESPVGDAAVTVSLGVAVTEPGEPFCYSTLFARADGALYQAKRTGRDRVCLAGRPAGAAAELAV